MSSSKAKFFPFDSTKFLESLNNYEPVLVLSEELFTPEWLDSKKLIITYAMGVKDKIENKLQQKLETLWRARETLINHKFQCNVDIIVKSDTEVSHDELMAHSFLIYGTPPSEVFSKYIEDCPLKIKDGQIIAGEKSYHGETFQLSIVIPNPHNPHRFLAFVMGTSPTYIKNGLYLSEVGKYFITRLSTDPNMLDIIEEGYIEINRDSKVIGIKKRKRYPADSNWQCTLSDNYLFCVRSDSLAQKEITYLINQHENAYRNIISTLKIEPKRDQFICYIHEKYLYDDFEKRGAYWPGTNIIHAVYNEERRKDYIGIHELVHAITYKYWGWQNKQAPLWAEGVATLLGWQNEKPFESYAAEIMYSHELLPMDHLLDNEKFLKHAPLDAYLQSASFVKFLIERCGWQKFSEMAKGLPNKPPKDTTVFEHVYNTAFAEMEIEWVSHITKYLKDHTKEIEEWRPLWSARRHMCYRRYPQAILDIKTILKKDIRDPYIFYLAGECYFFIGNFEEAIKNFLKNILLKKDI